MEAMIEVAVIDNV